MTRTRLKVCCIGSREEAETAGVEVYSAASPIGRALTGAREGETVEYETPNGRTMKLAVVAIFGLALRYLLQVVQLRRRRNGAKTLPGPKGQQTPGFDCKHEDTWW